MICRMIGIDIGMSGALAVVRADGTIQELVPLGANDEPRRSTIHLAITRQIQEAEEAGEVCLATIEEPPQVRPKGKQTNASAITGLWREFGLAIAACELNGVEFGVVPPISWQSCFWSREDKKVDPEFVLSSKDMARRRAASIWPGQSWVLTGSKEHDGAIDAALIAVYGIRRLFADKYKTEGASDDVGGTAGTI